MNMHGIIPGFPLPDNKWRGQISRNDRGAEMTERVIQ